MKIVCDNCATKYSIADEKVSGKVFKLRCKKCSHIIVVKGSVEGEAATQVVAPSSAGVEVPSQPSEPAPTVAQDAMWHLVIDREQVGPMTAAEVKAKFESGLIDADSYIWREGFDDWMKLSAVDEFRDLAAEARQPSSEDQVTDRASTADLIRRREEVSPAADLFGQSGSMPVQVHSGGRTASPTAPTVMGGAEDYAARAAHAQVPPAVADEAMASSPSPHIEVKSMTGARSENSVLFSLNNLAALASGSPGPAASSSVSSAAASSGPRPGYANAQTEGSGLIDIRAMAAQTLSASKVAMTTSKPDELPLIGDAPLFSPVAPAVLLPTAEPGGIPKWVWALVGGLGVVTVVIIGVLISLLKTPPQPVPAGPTPTGPVAMTGSETQARPPGVQPPTVTPVDTGPKTPVKEPEPAAEGEKKAGRKATKEPKERGGDREKPARPKEKETREAPPTPPPPVAEQPERKPPKPARPKDDLDSLLDSAAPGGGRPKTESSKKDAPEQLSMDTIKGVLKGVNAAAQSCGAPGTYFVKITIGRNGRVSDASVPGKAGDAGADCVIRHVKGARFPEFTGDPQSLSYPFILR